VISPIAPILRRAGVELALVSVELWPQETLVRLAALVDDSVAKDDAFGAALDAWAAAGREGPPPSEPGESLFKDVSVSLTDDLGTEYRWKTSSIGGTGRLFRGDWHFPVAVPDTANRLVVEASDADGQRGSCELLLSNGT
jgi:hypothetical protein